MWQDYLKCDTDSYKIYQRWWHWQQLYHSIAGYTTQKLCCQNCFESVLLHQWHPRIAPLRTQPLKATLSLRFVLTVVYFQKRAVWPPNSISSIKVMKMELDITIHVTRLSAREDSIEFCRCGNFKTYTANLSVVFRNCFAEVRGSCSCRVRSCTLNPLMSAQLSLIDTVTRKCQVKNQVICFNNEKYNNSHGCQMILSGMASTSVWIVHWYECTRWFKYDRDWFMCKQAALRSSCATLREWSHNLHPPSCSG